MTEKNKLLRLLLVTPHFEPDTAPTGLIFTALVDRWNELGHQVHVVTSLPWYKDHGLDKERKNCFIEKAQKDLVKITRVYPFPFRKTNFFLRGVSFLAFSFLTTIVSLLTKGPFDAVISVSPPPTLGFVGKISSIRHRCPLIFNIQDIFPDVAVDVGLLNSSFLINVSKRVEKNIYKNSDALTVLSDEMKTNVSNKLSGRENSGIVEVIPNFANSSFFIVPDKINNYRKKNGLGEKNVVMYAGNLGHSQPLELIVEMAKKNQEKKDLVYVINGGGVKYESLKKASMDLDNLVIVDYQPAENLPFVLSAADIQLVLLKTGLGYASVPSKIYNILAVGKPVVASVDLGTEIDRVVTRAEAGIVIKSEDFASLDNSVQFLLENPSLREHMGESGREWAINHSSAEVVGDAYIKLVRKLNDL